MSFDRHYGGDGTASTSVGMSALGWTPRAPRVSQVDADELDQDLVSMLGERVEKALSNFKRRSIDLQPELNLLISIAIFRYAILGSDTAASPGAKLQNLKLVTSPKRPRNLRRRFLLLYLLLHPPIFPAYILTRLRQFALSSQWSEEPPGTWRRASWTAIVRLETAAKGWELLGWGWFLWDGQYPSLLMRLLGLKLVPSSQHLARLVSYEFMNRQLVWGALTDFLTFALPNVPPLPTYLQPTLLLQPFRRLFDQQKIDYSAIGASSGTCTYYGNKYAHTGRFPDLPPSTCPICHLRYITSPRPLDSSVIGQSLSLPPLHGSQEPEREETELFVPTHTDCHGNCRYCYYCIAGVMTQAWEEHTVNQQGKEEKRDAGSKETLGLTDKQDAAKWECLRCGGEVTRFRRTGADLLDQSQAATVDDARAEGQQPV